MSAGRSIAALLLLLLAATACSEPLPSGEPPLLAIYIAAPTDDPHIWKIGAEGTLDVWINNPELIPAGPGPHKLTGQFSKTPLKRDDKTIVVFTILTAP